MRNFWRRRGWTARAVGALVIASRGIWSARECRAAERRYGGLARTVRVMSDAQAALLGALAGRPGVLLLAGTGSIAVGFDGRRRWARAGGFGPLLGDEGSGFWIGREWLRATTQGEDFDPVRRLVHAADPVARIAALAPRVLARARRSDGRARRIVRAGQRHLASLAVAVARDLGLTPPVNVSWAGSLLASPPYRDGVIRAVTRAGLKARWRRPAAEPIVAAVKLAESLNRTGQSRGAPTSRKVRAGRRHPVTTPREVRTGRRHPATTSRKVRAGRRHPVSVPEQGRWSRAPSSDK